MKFGIDWPRGFREEELFENAGHIHVYSPGAGADNPLGSFFSLSVFFSQFSPLLQLFPHSNLKGT